MEDTISRWNTDNREDRVAAVQEFLSDYLEKEMPQILPFTHDGKGIDGHEFGFDPREVLDDVNLFGVHIGSSTDGIYMAEHSNKPKKKSFADLIAAQTKLEESRKQVATEAERQYRIEIVKEAIYGYLNGCLEFPITIHISETEIGFTKYAFDPRPLVKEAVNLLKKEMQPGLDQMDIKITENGRTSFLYRNNVTVTFDMIRPVE